MKAHLIICFGIVGFADQAPLQRVGWQVGKDRVERIWRREGSLRSRSYAVECGSTMVLGSVRPTQGVPA
jgi:hypothetical protein